MKMQRTLLTSVLDFLILKITVRTFLVEIYFYLFKETNYFLVGKFELHCQCSPCISGDLKFSILQVGRNSFVFCNCLA